ncbi:MAG: hypothetical protein Q7S11_00930 [bacterium]|nr:hypothetical protein [bacterium]
MQPHALQFIPQEDLRIFHEIVGIVGLLPDIILGHTKTGREVPISCHVLTRALASIFETLEVKDGFIGYGSHYEHSWLQTSSGSIIDPYPFATVGGPIILADVLFWRSFYGPEICLIEHQQEPFTAWVETITNVVYEIYYNPKENKTAH